MRQTIKIGVVLLLALTVSLGWNMVSTSKKNDSELARLVAEKEMMAKDLSNQEDSFNLIMQLVEEVEGQIESIAKKQNLVVNAEPGEYLGGKQKLLKEIEMIDDLVNRSNASIDLLSDKLKTAGLKANVLQNKIKRLTASLNERSEAIEALKADLATKDINIKTLDAKVVELEREGAQQALEITQKDTQIEQLTTDNDKLNKVHFAVGTFKDLKERGLVQKEGGFLMFGRKTALVQDADETQFAEIDGRVFNKLPIEGSKLQLVSNHPSDSFVIVESEDNDNIKYLEILDSEEFWRISKYLVVSVK